jgi:hypothetical protein
MGREQQERLHGQPHSGGHHLPIINLANPCRVPYDALCHIRLQWNLGQFVGSRTKV